MQINTVLKDYRKYMFIDCGIENHNSVFTSLSEKDIANSVRRLYIDLFELSWFIYS